MGNSNLLNESVKKEGTQEKLAQARQASADKTADATQAQSAQASSAGKPMTKKEAQLFLRGLELIYQMEKAHDEDSKNPDPFKTLNLTSEMKEAYLYYKRERDEKKLKGNQIMELFKNATGAYGWNGFFNTVGIKGLDMAASSIGGWGGFLIKISNATGVTSRLLAIGTGNATAEQVVDSAAQIAGVNLENGISIASTKSTLAAAQGNGTGNAVNANAQGNETGNIVNAKATKENC